MQAKTFDRLLVFSIFFLAAWFFGNLYEEIVLVPNQIQHAYEKLSLWQGFFTVTNQIYYYVPFTHLAVIISSVLFVRANESTERRFLKKATIFGWLAILLTAVIVTQINLKLFLGHQLEVYRDQLSTLSIIWLMFNALRIYLVGMAMFFLIKTYLWRHSAIAA